MQTGKQRSVDSARFAMVPRNDVPRSKFSYAHTHKTTMYASSLVPVYVEEVLPGDSVKVNMTAFCRVATPLVPIMDNLVMESFFFFCPNRLVWDKWQRFMGEQTDPADVTTLLTPYITIGVGETLVDPGLPYSLADWFGITLNNAVGADIKVLAFPFRMYCLIYNEWFRDQDIDEPATVPTDDGPDTFASYGLAGGVVFGLYRSKRHDYFTSARPWPGKPVNFDVFSGMGSVTGFPNQQGLKSDMSPGRVGAPVSGLGVLTAATDAANVAQLKWSGGRTQTPAFVHKSDEDVFYMKSDGSGGEYPDVRVLINDIRTANMVQLFMERNARGGTRYAEIVRSHFGVVSPDSRLQRPEYLGGGKSFVTVNPVAQTSATGATGTTTVLGELAGIGTAVATNHGFTGSFTEHGFVIGIVSVRGDLTYQQGIERMWFRRTQFDYYWPATAHLGEQAIFSREIYATGSGEPGTGTDDDSIFGYQERWSEYKYKPNRISGIFRSSYGSPLDYWHLAQFFTGRPTLNTNFMQEAPPVDRVLQVNTTNSAQFLFDSVFNVDLVRCMPMFSIPGMGPRL